MTADRTLKEIERRVEADPDNPVHRLRLAAALRQQGRLADAMTIYRAIASHYRDLGRLVQALAVCRSVLEIDPTDAETQMLYVEIDAARTGAPHEEPTRLDDGVPAPGPREEVTNVRDDFMSGEVTDLADPRRRF